MANLDINIDVKGLNNVKRMEKEFKRFSDNVKRSQKELQKTQKITSNIAKNLALGLGTFFSVQGAMQAVKYLTEISDAYTMIDAKIKLVAKTQEEFIDARAQLLAMSKHTNTQLTTNAQAFAKLGNSMKGAQQQDVIDYLDTVNKSLIVSGATAQEASGFMIQFAQAMGSGVVNGDELRTMNEANSYLMAKVARQFDTNIAGLKKMGEENILTTKKFAEALKTVASEVENEYSRIPVTIGRAWNEVHEIWKNALAGADEGRESIDAMIKSIRTLGQVIEEEKDKIATMFKWIIDGASFSIKQVATLQRFLEGIQAADKGQLSWATAIFGTDTEVKNALKAYSEGSKVLTDMKGEVDALHRSIKVLQEGDAFGIVSQHSLDMIEAYKNEIISIETEMSYMRRDKEIALEFTAKLDTTDVMAQLDELQKDSAKAWLEEHEKSATKSIKKLTKEIEEANDKIIATTRDFTQEMRALGREGFSEKGQWDDINKEVDEYHKKASAAAKAGDWGAQADYLTRIKALVTSMPDSVSEVVSKDSVNKAKKIWEYQKRITNSGRNAYGDSKKKYDAAKKNYVAQLKALKEGTRDIISEDDARLVKMRELKKVNEEILKNTKKQNSLKVEEKTSLADELKAYKDFVAGIETENDGLVEGIDLVAAEWKRVEGVWTIVAASMVSDTKKVTDEINEAIKAMNKLNSGRSKPDTSFGGNYEYVPDGKSANGGFIPGGATHLVGERGPELFTPSSGGFVTPNHQMSEGSSVNISLDLGAGSPVALKGSQTNVNELVRQLKDRERFAA